MSGYEPIPPVYVWPLMWLADCWRGVRRWVHEDGLPSFLLIVLVAVPMGLAGHYLIVKPCEIYWWMRRDWWRW